MKNLKKIMYVVLIIIFLYFLMKFGSGIWNNSIAPNLGKFSEFSLPLILGLSFLAGAVSFFSPCSFAMFPGYMAFYLGAKEEKKESPAKLGMIASAGVISFFALLSILIIIIGQSVTQYLKFLAPSIGFLLVIFGIILVAGYSFKTGKIQKILNKLKSKETRSTRNVYLFGVGYGAVSLGCTLPLVFAMIIVPLTSGKILTAVLSMTAYALAMSILLIFVTFLISWSEKKLLKGLIKSTGIMKKIGGIALIIIGGYLIYINILFGMFN